MNKEILEYISSQRVGVLAVEMLDGSPHGATVHFAHTESPFQFFFETYQEYRKTEALYGREVSRATLVLGCDETSGKTLQMDGVVRLIQTDEQQIIEDVYLYKFPDKREKSKQEKMIFFTFIPQWWRFTDWTKPEGKVIILSAD